MRSAFVAASAVLLVSGVALAKEPKAAKAAKAAKDASMAVIPAGSVEIQDVGRKEVASFSIDVTEVTVDAYAACVRAGYCSKPGDASRRPTDSCNWGKGDRGNHPVNCVDWNQAKAFCGWAQKRLPTEEEWQLAAEGAKGRTYPWGENEPSNQLCWTPTSRDEGTCAVGSFPSGDSAQGVKDLSGNVWEWTDSWDGSLWSARVNRGGSWYYGYASSVRAAVRGSNVSSDRSSDLGFRCARSN
jgi:formylglycine-generating enzyme required for sulfatase activity